MAVTSLLVSVSSGQTYYWQVVARVACNVSCTSTAGPWSFYVQNNATTDFDFYTLAPCRIADTRGNSFSGQYGPPSLASGQGRTITVSGQCGIPADAVAVALNFTVTSMTAMGDLKVVPAGVAAPPVAALTWMGTTGVVSNWAIAGIGTGGAMTLIDEGSSSVDVIIDVNEYFR